MQPGGGRDLVSDLPSHALAAPHDGVIGPKALTRDLTLGEES
jgi:hypothetical protein